MAAAQPILKCRGGMAMEALYFGPRQELFGMRTEAAGAPRRTAVLICPSWGPEYMRWYRALYGLSQELAARGFESLRFDYSCTGDSEGLLTEADVTRWQDDIISAARELRMLSGAERIAVVGVRLGGLLAAAAYKRGLRGEQLVLWDAAPSGTAWLAQLQQLNHAFYQRKNRYLHSSLQLTPDPDQLVGFVVAPGLPAALEALQLEANALPRRTHVLRSRDDPGPGLAGMEESRLPDDAHWDDAAWLTTPWNSPLVLRAVGDQIERLLP
jgi:hypothetical protein